MDTLAYERATDQLCRLSYAFAGFLAVIVKYDELPEYHRATAADMLAQHTALAAQRRASLAMEAA